MRYRRLLTGGLAAAGVAASLAVPARTVAQQSAAITVFAASDLGPAFQKIIPEFEKRNRTKVTLVLGSTGTLAQQIRNGAPADVFFAADEAFINDMGPEGLIILQTRLRYARGRIVTVTLKSGSVRVNTLKDLTDPRVRRIAIANPAHAPYGLAAQQALEASGVWDALQPKLVYGENVQQALQFVRSGSADAGIIARAIVEGSDLNWKLVDTKLHAPIDQMAVVLTRTKQPGLALSFLEWVNGPQGRWVMRQFGFLLPGEHF